MWQELGIQEIKKPFFGKERYSEAVSCVRDFSRTETMAFVEKGREIIVVLTHHFLSFRLE